MSDDNTKRDERSLLAFGEPSKAAAILATSPVAIAIMLENDDFRAAILRELETRETWRPTPEQERESRDEFFRRVRRHALRVVSADREEPEA